MVLRRRAARLAAVPAFMRCRITTYCWLLPSDSKNPLACSFRSSAAARSGGMVALLCDSYAASHRPSAFADRTSSKPGARMRPAAMSASTRLTFTFDLGCRSSRSTTRHSVLPRASPMPFPSPSWRSSATLRIAARDSPPTRIPTQRRHRTRGSPRHSRQVRELGMPKQPRQPAGVHEDGSLARRDVAVGHELGQTREPAPCRSGQ